MTILTRDEIIKEIEEDTIKLNPYNKENIGPASIDLTLDNKFRYFKGEEEITLEEDTEVNKHSS